MRQSNFNDLDEIVACHMRVFPDALASLQGAGFVKKMLEWYLVSDRGILFQVIDDWRVVGYCGGIKIRRPGLPGAFTSISQYAFWAFVRSTLLKPWLVFHRENLKRHRMVFRNILIRLRLKKAAKENCESDLQEFTTAWGLVVIGVDPDFQGEGLGTRMLGEFERLAREDGVDCIQLSVKPCNQKAIAAYCRSGWRESARSVDSVQMKKLF